MPSSSDRDRHVLHRIIIACGIAWSVAFIIVGVSFRVQLYGDGAMFSYAVAVQDVWALHWHNISGRLTTYLLTMAPAEGIVTLARDPVAGVFAYGLLRLHRRGRLKTGQELICMDCRPPGEDEQA